MACIRTEYREEHNDAVLEQQEQDESNNNDILAMHNSLSTKDPNQQFDIDGIWQGDEPFEVNSFDCESSNEVTLGKRNSSQKSSYSTSASQSPKKMSKRASPTMLICSDKDKMDILDMTVLVETNLLHQNLSTRVEDDEADSKVTFDFFKADQPSNLGDYLNGTPQENNSEGNNSGNPQDQPMSMSDDLTEMTRSLMTVIYYAEDKTIVDVSIYNTVRAELMKQNQEIKLNNLRQMINILLISDKMRATWSKHLLSEDPALFYNENGQCRNYITLKMCPHMNQIINPTDMVNLRLALAVKAKDMTGDFYPSIMRCPQFSKHDGKSYVNSRDDLSLKHIMTCLLEYMSFKFCSEHDQDISDLVKTEIYLHGRVQDPDASRDFKEKFFRYYVGRAPRNYDRKLKKPRMSEGVEQKQTPGPEHLDLFEVKNSMYDACLRWLLENSTHLRYTINVILDSNEFMRFVDDRSLKAIYKVIDLTAACSEYPYSKVQNKLCISLLKKKFNL